MSYSIATESVPAISKFGSAAFTQRVLLAAIWCVFAIVLLILFREEIAQRTFMDTDDAMRLQQVRDWIAGQTWFDVSQHRINPPTGGPMHWSRIVDLPIAAIILLARPLVGQPAAEILACAIVPLLTLLAVYLVLFRVALALVRPRLAYLTVALLLLTPTIVIQFTPMRVDHHGWQVLMATIALGGALDPRHARGGFLAGFAIATWLQISTEGLPYAALFGAVFTLRQAYDARETVRLKAFSAALGIGAVLLLLLTRGTGSIVQSQCDAMSAVFVWPLAFFAVIMVAGGRIAPAQHVWGRLAVPAIGAIVAIISLLWIGTDCLVAGPFHELTPLAHKQWYMRVLEGRPLWEQISALAGVSLLPSLLGLGATLAAAVAARDSADRVRWLVLATLLLGALAVSVLVLRAMTVAHVFALPGTAWLIATLFNRIQDLRFAVQRVVLSVTLILATPVGIASAWASLAEVARPTLQIKKDNCRTAAMLAPLRSLPPSLLFAPLDIGPDILVHTNHSVVGTGHHRNVIGINAVTHAFLSTPEQARLDVMAVKAGRGADYLVMCPRMNEMLLYAQDAPNGLAAQLARGRIPQWLEPLPTKGPLKIYRIRPPRS